MVLYLRTLYQYWYGNVAAPLAQPYSHVIETVTTVPVPERSRVVALLHAARSMM